MLNFRFGQRRLCFSPFAHRLSTVLLRRGSLSRLANIVLVDGATDELFVRSLFSEVAHDVLHAELLDILHRSGFVEGLDLVHAPVQGRHLEEPALRNVGDAGRTGSIRFELADVGDTSIARKVAYLVLPVVRAARNVEHIVEPSVLGAAAILDEVFSLFEDRFGVVCQADEKLLFLFDDSQQLVGVIDRRLRPNAVRKSKNEEKRAEELFAGEYACPERQKRRLTVECRLSTGKANS